ncbi:MAG: prolyl oligopeptidase family serine peptidase [Proteobacteria bacterium]|nr:prolyl oligopeptidase family serine peptidase [Pseudomonadota bacterium]
MTQPPPTPAIPVTQTIHGKTIADPYRWLEDEHAPEVQAWMTAQDTHARAALAQLPARPALVARLKQLFYFDSISAPTHRQGRYFYSRKHADKEKAVVYWKQGEAGAETVLLDPNAWSADGSKSLHGTLTSRDGRYVAYQVSAHNSDESVTEVMEVATGRVLPDRIEGTKYGLGSWNPAATGFYYTWVPPIGGEVTIAARPGFDEVRFHALGSDAAHDPVIYPATGSAETFLGGGLSEDGHWLYVAVQHGWNSTDLYYRDARDPDAPWITLVEGTAATYDLEFYADAIYLRTNADAPNYRMVRVDAVAHAAKLPGAWQEIVATCDTPIDGFGIVGGKLTLSYLRNAASVLEVRALDGTPIRTLALPGIGTASGIAGNQDEDTGYFSFTSFTEPQIIYKTSIATGQVDEWARITLPIDASAYVTEQVFYPSKDGTSISMFLIRRKDAARDGRNPTILYGYGGFNVSLTPGFSSSRIVWLEQGGMLAIPNLRGGGEYGEAWHRAGMLEHKQNVFDDFIAAADYLIAQRWTSPARLAVQGGSNGGLLTGALVTQRPELVAAVICAVPLLDMLRFHLSGSGKTWVPEYGNPDDAAQFPALYAYSPYRVAVDAGPVAYPAILFDSSDHDDRVDPLHARKLAAALQHATTGVAPILLRIERNAGHGGADDVKSAVERVADAWAFLLAQLV